MHNDIRSYNIGIFENTMAKIKDDASLGKVINESISNQMFHLKPVDIKSIAPIIGGKGGGKPDSAMGGGTDVLKLDDALAALDDFVALRLDNR